MTRIKTTFKQKIETLSRATSSFKATKKKIIAKICSAGVRHKILKYPSLLAAVLFVFFVNIIFYVSLWVILNKRRAVGVLLVIVSAIGLIVISREYMGSDRLYKTTEDNFVVHTAEKQDFEESASIGDEVPEKDSDDDNEIRVPQWWESIDVDFAGLQKENEDVVGWIYFENENISYPILYGETDDDYIRTTYDGKYSRAGSIFLESMNNSDFNDFNTIIYGHNMRNLSMFGKLKYYYTDTDYYNDHKYFQIITPDKKYRYEVIAYKRVNADHSIYQIDGIIDETKNEYVQKSVMANSLLGVTVQVADTDHIVTLSTCSNADSRFVLSAIRIDEH